MSRQERPNLIGRQEAEMTRVVHAPLIVALAAMVLAGAPPRAEAPAREPILMTTRVIYLQEMNPRDAMSLVRGNPHILSAAMVLNRNALVISDVADKIDQAEKLLRQRNAVLQVADPHAPLATEALSKAPPATRVFDVGAGSMDGVMAVLRAIYQVRDIQKSEQESRITIRAAQPILDASEALLRELDLIAGTES